MASRPISSFLHAAALAGGALSIALIFPAHPSLAQTNEPQHTAKPLPVKPDNPIPGVQVNHRLILRDGSYQIVRKYEVVGNRVRFISVERGGDWEEIPEELIDWPATRKWEKQQAEQAQQKSPAMEEAAAIDKEEADERQSQKDRQPEVSRGLNLPDQDGVFILDEYQGTPQLVEVVPSTGDLQMARQHGLRSVLPLQGQLAHVELEGAGAKVSIHINEPTIYLSLDSMSDDSRAAIDKVTSQAMTVDTHGASQVQHPKRGATSATSGFAIVRVDSRKAVRIVGTVHVSPTGNITQDEDVIPMTVEVLPGKHWIKLKPKAPLLIGQYALVEILSAKDMNASVWDFGVNPRAGLNESAIGPIQSK